MAIEHSMKEPARNQSKSTRKRRLLTVEMGDDVKDIMVTVSRENIARFSTINRKILSLPHIHAILADAFGCVCDWMNAECRFASEALRARKTGMQYRVYLRPDGHLSLTCDPDSMPAPDGIWLSDGDDTGCYCVAGIGSCHYLSAGGKTYGTLRCFDDYFSIRQDTRTVPYRNLRGYDCNVKRWKIENRTLLDQGFPPLLVGILQSVHRWVYAQEGDKVYHTEHGIIAHGVRHKKEGALLAYVRDLFPTDRVLHKYRGRELEGLEIDVYVADRRIGFEYQGYQHYHPIELFGGKDRLIEQKARDARKRELCFRNGIQLIEIRYDEVLDKTLVERKLREAGHQP